MQNTQEILTKRLFKKTLLGSFHGSWCLASFVVVLIGLLLLSLEISTFNHFSIVSIICLILLVFNCKYLVKAKNKKVEIIKKKGFVKPNATLIWLGIIGFYFIAR